MNNDIKKVSDAGDYRSIRGIRPSMKVVFSCLTAIPFFVFAFIRLRQMFKHSFCG